MENIPELQSMSASNGLQLILVSIMVVAYIIEKIAPLFARKKEYVEKQDYKNDCGKMEKKVEKIEDRLNEHLEGGKK